MPWVRFTADYDESFGSRRMIRHTAGRVRCVRRGVAKQAIEAGAAIPVERPLDLRSTYAGGVREVSNGR